jgi:hypothetical protein
MDLQGFGKVLVVGESVLGQEDAREPFVQALDDDIPSFFVGGGPEELAKGQFGRPKGLNIHRTIQVALGVQGHLDIPVPAVVLSAERGCRLPVQGAQDRQGLTVQGRKGEDAWSRQGFGGVHPEGVFTRGNRD